ncbi:hypothetical protein I553_6721 [Mycobacterium xenopi 4042]|uniref:Uncharacterized protein n=1 Tax=Mycobacterium xenopi 4042 TaxID=1299334 RepID=X8DCR9_MYCXE|nr:hypothetical protein I553_6721 [Mycobacterium xenopi 4042]
MPMHYIPPRKTIMERPARWCTPRFRWPACVRPGVVAPRRELGSAGAGQRSAREL